MVTLEKQTLSWASIQKIFCVTKPDTNIWRMIDMRKLNKYIKKKSFKMQGVKDVRAALDPGMHVSVIDISDAYFHVSIHKKA